MTTRLLALLQNGTGPDQYLRGLFRLFQQGILDRLRPGIRAILRHQKGEPLVTTIRAIKTALVVALWGTAAAHCLLDVSGHIQETVDHRLAGQRDDIEPETKVCFQEASTRRGHPHLWVDIRQARRLPWIQDLDHQTRLVFVEAVGLSQGETGLDSRFGRNPLVNEV